ncbi:DUF1254 domain-containing protein [Kitasatospora sp. NPDC048296]|uniref:DUF1254 domain-containing protein n=1 Tax=Kitasatospora sp. NPDC048296 TaxID=3364048 RepID=UPI00370F9BD3
MNQPELEALAADAYVYGYPLVAALTMVERFAKGGLGTLPAEQFNHFSHATRLARPGDQFVSVNNDTIYSIAQLDLSEGPLVLHVPDTAGAYYVLQFIDAWTDNVAYLGRRATGTDAQTWLIVPPDWHGTPSDPSRVIELPTTVGTVVGRFACAGPGDLPRVKALQAGLVLEPLEPGGLVAGLPEPGGLVAGLPEPDPDVPERLAFFERLRVWMQAFPPATPDIEYQRRFAPLGLLDDGASPYRAAAADWTLALAKGLAAGRERVEDATRPPEDHPPGEWRSALHLFDYNLDHLGPGTLHDPEWRIPDRRAAYLSRAAAARAGLWGNHAYEASYATTYDDSDGRPLTGANSYTLRFDQPPPAEAFWSVTMYSVPDYYLVENPVDRYSIGDRTPGLVYGDDGSLTLTLQHDQPEDPTTAANWLPTPHGEFRPIIRLYQPKPTVLDGTYQIPPIHRT